MDIITLCAKGVLLTVAPVHHSIQRIFLPFDWLPGLRTKNKGEEHYSVHELRMFRPERTERLKNPAECFWLTADRLYKRFNSTVLQESASEYNSNFMPLGGETSQLIASAMFCKKLIVMLDHLISYRCRGFGAALSQLKMNLGQSSG